MIAADTSSLVAFLQGDEGDDVRLLDEALRRRQVVLPAIVVCEMLSFPGRGSRIVQLICDLPRLDPRPGAWVRAGAMRRTLLARGLRARLADTLIAQICLDFDVPLVTRDRDSRRLEQYAGLRLLC